MIQSPSTFPAPVGHLGDPAAAGGFEVSGFPSPTTAGILQNFTVTAQDVLATRYQLHGHHRFHQYRYPGSSADELHLHQRRRRSSYVYAALKTAGNQTLLVKDTAATTFPQSIGYLGEPGGGPINRGLGLSSFGHLGYRQQFHVSAEDAMATRRPPT